MHDIFVSLLVLNTNLKLYLIDKQIKAKLFCLMLSQILEEQSYGNIPCIYLPERVTINTKVRLQWYHIS